MEDSSMQSKVSVVSPDREEEVAPGASEELVQSLVDVVGEISAISEFKNAYRRQFCNLSRRIKLLGPLIEELRESKNPIPDNEVESLGQLRIALESAKELLRLGSEGSKIFLVLETDHVNKRFCEVTSQLEQALAIIPFNKLDVSDEVREQVELVYAQLKRAKERADTADLELYTDLLSIYNMDPDASVDPVILKRLAEKLQLITIPDLMQESLALHEMVVSSGGDPGKVVEKMSNLLKKIKDFVQTESPEVTGKVKNGVSFLADGQSKGPVIPNDFRCPISLELMKDPVIVSTGQTYERSCIEQWLGTGHNTCPKTQQKLSSHSLTPNYVLRSLIAQWCESNGLDPPKVPALPNKSQSACSAAEHSRVLDLLQKLSSQSLDDQRLAVGELRLLAKRNTENRACIAEAGAIPLLVSLLTVSDLRTQEHAVTALLNLSIYEDNKGKIITSGAVLGIVHVLKRGSMEARENAAATLFSLSVIDENKVTIGAAGAIPPLVSLLSNGTQRGKKDAATALFNLCIYQGNKGKAVRAGVIPILMDLLLEPGSSMMDEALAILAILSSHPEGKVAIGAASAVPVLVDVIRNGSSRNKENAAAVLVHLCNGDQQHRYLIEAQEHGVVSLLEELANNGTDRGKRKATLLLERFNRFLGQQQQAEAQLESRTQGRVEPLIHVLEQVQLDNSTADV
ncbi:U-box domain-containing protein 13 [Rhynchospora pubera]|uniref:U-box domain-containing protein 12 n=2 Tax=Rhynchospora pubera TaxID=906938 RepID=A0AAV8CE77_9POAL|nr:U-box domain-containing protein 13 [Rhynchospora pubera]